MNVSQRILAVIALYSHWMAQQGVSTLREVVAYIEIPAIKNNNNKKSTSNKIKLFSDDIGGEELGSFMLMAP